MKIIEKKLNKDILAKVDHVSMQFKLKGAKYDTLKERVAGLLKKKNKTKKITVLEDVSFEVKRGESLGVIGQNGAGKSTLLKIVAGIYPPSTGTVQTNGKIMLLNIGAGFDMEASAEENIYLSGAILGFTRKQMREKFDSIIEFSELQDFMGMPLKNYSSGMISRLGFAIAINIEPDLLLVDEVLSVGDANFQKKCHEKIDEFKKKGVSFLFVSHSLPQVKRICENVLWIENSKVMAYGPAGEVCDKYARHCASQYEKQRRAGAVAQSTTLVPTHVNLNDYLDKFKNLEDYVFVFSARDESSRFVDGFTGKDRFGLDMQIAFRGSYVAVVDKSREFVYEESSESAIEYEYVAYDKTVKVSSAGFFAGSQSSVVVSGSKEDLSTNSRGLNIVVLNSKTFELVDSINCDMFADRNLMVHSKFSNGAQ